MVGKTMREAAHLSPQLKSTADGKSSFRINDKIYYVASFHYADAQVVRTAFKIMPLEQEEVQVASTFSKHGKSDNGFKACYSMRDIIGDRPAMHQIKEEAQMFA